MQWGLRGKILASTGVIILGVLGISTVVQIQYSKRDYLGAVEWRSEALAQSLSAEIVNWAGSQHDPAKALKGSAFQCRQVYELNQDQYVTHAALLLDSGLIVVHNERDRQDTQETSAAFLDQLKRHEITTFLEGQSYHTLIPVFGADEAYLGTIDIGHQKQVVDVKIQQILRRSVILFLLFVILIFLPVSGFVHAFVINPIKKLTTSATALASGDLDHDIDVRGADEPGVLAQSFVLMRDAVRKKMRELHQLNTDLDREIAERTHELETLQQVMQNITQAVGQLGQASDNLTHISAEMSAGAEHTSQQVQIVSSSSQHVSQSVRDVSVSVEEVTASIQEIFRNVREVSTIITHAVEISTMTNGTITELTRHSQDIGNITKIITNVAQQTNLLALNATIEAARAGDSGRGFAVVANEVKNLAHETALATDDITQKIEAIQVSSENTTVAMAKLTDIIQRVSELSTTIAAAIAEQNHLIADILVRIADSSQGSAAITTAIADVAAHAEESSERATQVREGAQLLFALAQQFRQLVDDFTLSQEAARPIHG